MPAPSLENTVSTDAQSPSITPKMIHIDVDERQNSFSARRELVSITVAKDDYARLKAAGGPHPDHIDMALRYYLNVMKETRRHPRDDDLGWRRGPVISFLCAIPKHLSEEIRNLTGRFDSHTIEAVRLYLLSELIF